MSINDGGKNQLDHLMKLRSLVFTINSLKGTSLGRTDISSMSPASQLTEFRKMSPLSLLKKNLFRAKSESPKITNVDEDAPGFSVNWLPGKTRETFRVPLRRKQMDLSAHSRP